VGVTRPRTPPRQPEARPNGQLGSGRESERPGGGGKKGKKKASLAQAGEKLKDTANK
jgi:hypothetical protein